MDAEGLGLEAFSEDRETVIKELKKSLKIKVRIGQAQDLKRPGNSRGHREAVSVDCN